MLLPYMADSGGVFIELDVWDLREGVLHERPGALDSIEFTRTSVFN